MHLFIARADSAANHLGDLDILNRNARQVSHRNLIFVRPALLRILYDIAEFENGIFFDLTFPHCKETFAVIDALRNAVRHHPVCFAKKPEVLEEACNRLEQLKL